MKSPELVLELATPELADGSGPHHHEHLPGLGQQLQDALDDARKVIDDRDRGLVVPERCVTEILLIHGREQDRRLGKELLPMLAREDRGGAGDRDDQVRFGTIDEGGSDVLDHRLFRRADKPGWTHHDLDDVHGSIGALIQFDAEVGGELVHRDVAAVERLQHQHLTDRGLGAARCRGEEKQNGEPSRWSTTKRILGSNNSMFAGARIYIIEHESVAGCPAENRRPLAGHRNWCRMRGDSLIRTIGHGTSPASQTPRPPR